jgi:X-Pro dipeptidyl-peptidase C-terminal non-catalytic domain
MAQPWAKISGGAAPTSIEPTLLEGSIDVDRDNIPIWPAALPKFNRCPYRKSHPFGVLNLTHRDGHENPAPLAVGKRYRVRVQPNDAGAVFPAGRRVRLALSTATRSAP